MFMDINELPSRCHGWSHVQQNVRQNGPSSHPQPGSGLQKGRSSPAQIVSRRQKSSRKRAAPRACNAYVNIITATTRPPIRFTVDFGIRASSECDRADSKDTSAREPCQGFPVQRLNHLRVEKVTDTPHSVCGPNSHCSRHVGIDLFARAKVVLPSAVVAVQLVDAAGRCG